MQIKDVLRAHPGGRVGDITELELPTNPKNVAAPLGRPIVHSDRFSVTIEWDE
jgi:hypothetical protein